MIETGCLHYMYDWSGQDFMRNKKELKISTTDKALSAMLKHLVGKDNS